MSEAAPELAQRRGDQRPTTYWDLDEKGLLIVRCGIEHRINLLAECGSMCSGGLVDLLPLLSDETLSAVMAEIGVSAFDHAQQTLAWREEDSRKRDLVIAERSATQRLERLRKVGNGDLRCRACGSEESLEIDHILPRSRGGSNRPENLQLLCAKCNGSKGAKTMEEWLGAPA